jgi:hypothetical protein
MKNYIKELEKQNEELQSSLTESLTCIEMLNSRNYFTISIMAGINQQLIPIEQIHLLFHDKLSAGKRLKKNWYHFIKKFNARYVPHGFQFKFFIIDSYSNQYLNSESITEYSWAFETIKDLNIHIKELK